MTMQPDRSNPTTRRGGGSGTAYRPRSLVAVLIVAALWTSSAGADITATWNGTTGDWTDVTRWSTNPVFPNNNGPNLYDAVINAGVVTLNQDITINQFALSGTGTLDGGFTLNALEGLQWNGGAIRGNGSLTLGTGPTTPSTITGSTLPLAPPLILSGRTVNNAGTTTFTAGTIRGGSGATINNLAGANFTVIAGANFFADVANPSYTISNAGTFTSLLTAASGFTTVDALFNSTGTLSVESTGGNHTLSLAGGGTLSGPIQLQARTTLELGRNTVLQGSANITGPGTSVVAGNVTIASPLSASNVFVSANSTLNVNAAFIAGTLVQIAPMSNVRLNGATLQVGSGDYQLFDGTLTGTGTVNANLISHDGIVAPGNVLGSLTVTGSATLGDDGQLAIQIGGTAPASVDLLAVSGPAFLDGLLNVYLVNGFIPTFQDTFTILTASNLVDFFENAPVDGQRFFTADNNGNSFLIDYRANSVVLTGFAIPEPSVGALAFGWLVALAARRRFDRAGRTSPLSRR